MHPMLNIAVKAARKAGSIINRASFDGDQVRGSRKQHNDFVTEVARAANVDVRAGADDEARGDAGQRTVVSRFAERVPRGTRPKPCGTNVTCHRCCLP